jgi:SAM-dependent methyltransferase
MNNFIGLSETVYCNICQDNEYACNCAIPNYIKTNNTMMFNAYKNLYEEICRVDKASNFQSNESLIQKANEDLLRIIQIKEKYFRELNRQDYRILEIGPGLGHLGKLLIENGFQYFATDIVPDYLVEFPLRSFLANVEQLPKFQNKFNLIIACDVFEHVLNEGDAILSVSESLCDNGCLYIRSPFLEPLINYATKLGAPYPFIHIRTYTKILLRNLVESVGLEVNQMKLGNVVMVSHTRRNLFLNKSNFEKLRKDLLSTYGVKNDDDQSLNGVSQISKFEKKYREFEDRALRSSGQSGIYWRLQRWLFFRPTEIWCTAIKK